MSKELEIANRRIAQLENAATELLCELKNSHNPIDGRVLRAWTNLNNVLTLGKL